METPKCQMYCIKPMADETVRYVPRSLTVGIKVLMHRHLSMGQKRAIKKFANTLKRTVTRTEKPAPVQTAPGQTIHLSAGDRVRVRSWEEIEATLDAFRSYKGLAFMPEMEPYIGTTQRVFKVLNRFFDEREYQIRKAKGIVLLEGVMCEGTALFGPCDRSCFFFWREEWLEKIEEPQE